MQKHAGDRALQGCIKDVSSVLTGLDNGTLAAHAVVFSESKDIFAKNDKWL